ncbi:MAG: single-stranded-DNA-specific exonuclease RecJ [Planctomycetes bacterium]|nr:single-stranded-DNA-specific exonuclease RecJ [Planctomycetota bacterium]
MVSPALQTSTVWRPKYPDPGVVAALRRSLPFEPILATVLANRGVGSPAEAEAFLAPSVDALRDPLLLADMDKAAQRVTEAVLAREPILIYGDADVDGLSSTALLVQFLRVAGQDPLVYVPNRAYDGYSFTDVGIARCVELGAKVVVSVDNGITSVAPVAELQRRGLDVIVTDHHLPPDVLPPAHAVVNPNRVDCPYPFKGLAGVGVAFKLACAVAGKLAERGRAREPLKRALAEVLAWVAFGTVSDVMPLVDENRVLVSRGLRAIALNTSPGLAALCKVSNLNPADSPRSEDIAFRLAPRINAARRLGRSDLALELMTTTDAARATVLASDLDRLNRERQQAERSMLDAMRKRLARIPVDRPVLMASDDWSPGFLGLVAGRICRERGRPAVLVAGGQGDGPAKGSVRSVVGFDAHAALAACDEHLEEHGGHAMAAGFSIRPESIPAFIESFEAVWDEHVRQGFRVPPLEYEGELPLAAVTPRLLDQLERLEPFGEANRPPVLGCMGIDVLEARRMGGDGLHLAMQLSQGGEPLRAVAFDRGSLADALRPADRIDALFRPRWNRYRGRAQVELEIVDLRPSRDGSVAPCEDGSAS